MSLVFDYWEESWLTVERVCCMIRSVPLLPHPLPLPLPPHPPNPTALPGQSCSSRRAVREACPLRTP